MGNGRSAIAAIVIVIGILALIAGAMYVSMPAHSLPSFFPGHHVGEAAKHTKRGVAGLAVGVVLVIAGIVMLAAGRRRSYRRY